jgi:hypothetical protein
MARRWSQTPWHNAGPNLKVHIVEEVRKRAIRLIRSCVSSMLLADIAETLMGERADDPSHVARTAAIRAADAVCPPTSAAARWLARAQKHPATAVSSFLLFRDGACSQPELAWLSFYEFFNELFGLNREAEAIEGLAAAASGADWFLPHEHICWVSERPIAIHLNEKGQLHNETGPALQYRDGATVYAWKGIELDRRFIEEPHTVKRADIDAASDFQLRRCMIERMTIERYIGAGGALRAGQDEAGILWRKIWRDGDAWAAVEVENGTPEPDGKYKHYFLQVPPHMPSALAAVAWTYGLTARDYRGLIKRT